MCMAASSKQKGSRTNLFTLCLRLVSGVSINNKATRCDYMPYWSVTETVAQRWPCILICLTVNRWGNKAGREEAALNLNYSKMKISGVEEHDKMKGGFVCDQQGEGHHQLTHSSLQSSFIMAHRYFLSFYFNSESKLGTLCMILTAVKVRTLCNVAVGSENQLHILDNALPTQRGGVQGRDRKRQRYTWIGEIMD